MHIVLYELKMHRQLAVFSAKRVRAEISTSLRVKKNLLSTG